MNQKPEWPSEAKAFQLELPQPNTTHTAFDVARSIMYADRALSGASYEDIARIKSSEGDLPTLSGGA